MTSLLIDTEFKVDDSENLGNWLVKSHTTILVLTIILCRAASEAGSHEKQSTGEPRQLLFLPSRTHRIVNDGDVAKRIRVGDSIFELTLFQKGSEKGSDRIYKYLLQLGILVLSHTVGGGQLPGFRRRETQKHLPRFRVQGLHK